MEEPARCISCGYILEKLEHIPHPRCPECGRPFNPEDPGTFSRKPLFIAWRYWLPAAIFSVCAGTVLCVLILFTSQNVGLALTICLPFAVGNVLGYSVRIWWLQHVLLALVAMAAIGMLALVGNAGGLFCIILLFLIALGPLLIGVLAGALFRHSLKNSKFSQRAHLPILILLMSQPFAVAVVEHFIVYKYANRSVETTTTMPVSIDQAWSAVMFYEQVKHSPPLLLRLGLSRPLYSYGSMTQVGDTKTCVYDHGTLVKKITRVEPGKLIEFAVIRQDIELCGAKLKSGSFRFEPISPNETRVILTTEYEPILAPRFAWQPWEDVSVHTLHTYVLSGMQEQAKTHAH